MKQKIKEALKQGNASRGLDDTVLEGVATSIEPYIKEEAEIGAFVNGDFVKRLLDLEQADADRKRAKSTKQKAEGAKAEAKEGNTQTEQPTSLQPDFKAMLAEALAEVVNPLKEELANFKSEQNAKSAFSNAESSFKSNDYVKKYADEANDAWERATELYEATGKSWTAEELGEKAMGYFNKAVSKRGVDTSKPFQSDGGSKSKVDFSKDVELLRSEGVEFAE